MAIQTLKKLIPTKLSDLQDDNDELDTLVGMDMLPAVHDEDDKVLTDENGQIILRY
jgi:hypothetical protein